MKIGNAQMIALALLILTAAAALVIYIRFILIRFLKAFGLFSDKKLIRAAVWAAAAAVTVTCVNVFSLSTMIILHVVVLSLPVLLADLLLRKIKKENYERLNIWKKLCASMLIPILATVCVFAWGHYNMLHVVKTDYTVYTDKSIRASGYRVALIADVHFGVSVDLDAFKEKCREISGQSVDMLLLCGDIVDENTSKEEMKEVFKALGGIDTAYGSYYVYGNHDRQLYSSSKTYSEEELEAAIEGAGITILRDGCLEINEDIVLVGREDAAYHISAAIEGERKSIDELIKGIDSDKFILVMDHQPKEYEENSLAGTDLLLSGHTHAGQMWPANILFKFLKLDDAVYGYTNIRDMQAFVTSGFAGWGYSVKTSSPAEYVIIDIKGKNS